MKNTFGNNISITLFGESHGEAVGAIVDGLPAGLNVNEAFISHQLKLRKSISKMLEKLPSFLMILKAGVHSKINILLFKIY